MIKDCGAGLSPHSLVTASMNLFALQYAHITCRVVRHYLFRCKDITWCRYRDITSYR